MGRKLLLGTPTACLVLGLLTACGGGSSSTNSPETVNPTPTNFTVTATANDGGTISPASLSLTSGTTATFTVTASDGYNISSVVDCGGSHSGESYTTEDITSNCSVTANFQEVPNQPPSVNAGIDQTVEENMPVTLSGSATDSDGTISSYRWTQISGTTATLSVTNEPNLIFTLSLIHI